MENFDTPGSRTEAVLQNMLGADNPLESPKSRVEEILQACLNDEPITVSPQSRVEELLIDVVRERGGVDVSVQELDVNQNGSYTAPMGTAYSPVVVNVAPSLMTKEIISNGTYTATEDSVDGYSEVTVNVSGGGSTPVPKKDVNFVDYDGTILYSYTAQEALALTELPANPSHTGLTAQGWNWDLADMKENVEAVGSCIIGQKYITDDGKTRLYIHFSPNIPENLWNIYVRFSSSIDNNVTINWGDGVVETKGSTTVTNYAHTYTNAGDYVITLEVTSGTITLIGDSFNSIYGPRTSDSDYYKRCLIKKVEIGGGVTSIETSAFSNCYALTSITIPDSVTSIGQSAFSNCSALASITIPDSVTSIASYAFSNCSALTSITIPDSVTRIESYAFSGCPILASITIPDSVTSIASYAFSNCSALTSITIPDSVTRIVSYAFSGCPILASITIPDSITIIESYAFSNCHALTPITIPDSVTSIGQCAFNGCYILTSITIPDSVTRIESYAFSNCYALTSITIPDSVTSIGKSAFSGCYSLSAFYINREQPPALSSSNAFNSVSSELKIYVPYSEDHSILEAYQTATNWSTFASKMVEEPV